MCLTFGGPNAFLIKPSGGKSMVRKQLLKRASYIGVALVLMLAAVPIVPSRKVFAEEGDCIDKGYKL